VPSALPPAPAGAPASPDPQPVSPQSAIASTIMKLMKRNLRLVIISSDHCSTI
jgi:hypothetical protein